MDRLNADSAHALAESKLLGEALRQRLPDPLSAQPQPSAEERMARIVRTIEAEIIPRLVRSHRTAGADALPSLPVRVGSRPGSPQDVEAFTALVLADDDAGCARALEELRERGFSTEQLYLELLAPAARELGRLWEEDFCTFSDVTVAVGRLQSIMRSLSPLFDAEVALPADGRRALLLPAPGEQHTFGLSMVAEFFRRAGWDVVCELDARTVDPVGLVRAEWFDVIGISAGVDARVDWLKSGIAAVRHASCNRAIGVMVGGPIFSSDPSRGAGIGADALATDGQQAPALAERLLNDRARRL